jgi:diguanylate cyclase (GGDEF)-like protein
MLAALKHADELKEAAFQDPLTGVGNRRFIEMKLVSSLAEFKQHGLALALLFLDVDDFKKVNDTFGHEIGDRVLQMVANTLRHNIRSFDWLGRWGGEEFVIVLLNVDEDQVESIANKLRALVASSNLPAEQGDMQVTVSVGATLIRPDDTLETLVQRADNLMYQSKKSGKNRVTFSI